jgi:hypothetical protein
LNVIAANILPPSHLRDVWISKAVASRFLDKPAKVDPDVSLVENVLNLSRVYESVIGGLCNFGIFL